MNRIIKIIFCICILATCSEISATEKNWRYRPDIRASIVGKQPSILTTHGVTYKENFFIGAGTGYLYLLDHMLPIYGTIRGYLPLKNIKHSIVLNLDLGASFFIGNPKSQLWIFYGNLGVGIDWKLKNTDSTISTMIVAQTAAYPIPVPLPGISISYNF